MDIRFDGKYAVVTGAGRGIGRAIARVLGASGACVYVSDVIEQNATNVRDEIRAFGGEAEAFVADVTKPEQLEKLMQAPPVLDIMVNTAGIIIPETLFSAKQEDIDKIFQINAIGSSNSVRAAFPRMREQGHGRILLIASATSRNTGNMIAHYGMTKASVVSLAMAAAEEGAHYGINVNAICPGIIFSHIWEVMMDRYVKGNSPADREAWWKALVESIVPGGKEQTCEDIANSVAFMVSDQAKNITGQSLSVDGGMWLGF